MLELSIVLKCEIQLIGYLVSPSHVHKYYLWFKQCKVFLIYNVVFSSHVHQY